MKAVALAGVLIVAKLAMLVGHPIQTSVWIPIAYFWQDLLVALTFGALDRLLERYFTGRIVSWILYGATVIFVAANVPVARVLSSPLTWPMLNATRGALRDSITHHATLGNLSLLCLVLATGVALPFLLHHKAPWLNALRRRKAIKVSAILILVLFVGLGQVATSRVETSGLGRNAIAAMVTTMLPRISAQTGDVAREEDWRSFAQTKQKRSENLSRFRGAASGRNVVLILLESTGARYLQNYGSGRDPMPNLTELARSSLIFENAYSVYPESIKGLFSVLCSRYPAMDTDAESYAKTTTPSIALALKQEGYRTALFHSGRFMYLGMEAVIQGRGYDVLEDAGAIGGNRESSFGVDEQSTVRRALDWMDSLKPNDRFFLTYLPIAGHHPYDTPGPGPYSESTDSDRYLNALHYADQSLGDLIKGIRARGLEERTLFVIFGDHGEAFGQHEGNFGHSLLLYDENIRVPYLIAAPGLIREGQRVTRTISLIDTAPTILDLLGVRLRPEYQGLSALRAKSDSALFYTDYSLTLMGLRDGCWKYIYELESGRSKLFDLCSDPEEVNDLASSHPELTTAYRAHVSRWTAAQKALIKEDRGEY